MLKVPSTSDQDALGLRTKTRNPNNGRRSGGVPFTRGHIYKLLSNPIYIGDIVHKDERFEGEHQAIIDHETWEAAQAQLRCNAIARRRNANTKTHSLLTGLLVDADGKRIVPTYANKAGRRYRYYVPQRLKEASSDGDAGWRLPAQPIEDVVVTGICRLLHDRHRLIEVLGLKRAAPTQLRAILSRSSQLGDRLRAAGPSDQRDLLSEMIDRIVVRDEAICTSFRADMLLPTIGRGEVEDNHELQDMLPETTVKLELPVPFKRRGVEMKLVLSSEQDSRPDPHPVLIKVVADGHSGFEELTSGTASSVGHLAQHHGINQGDVSRRLPLAFLAPDIVAAILQGRQPIELTAARLMRVRDLPISWAEQRQRLGLVG